MKSAKFTLKSLKPKRVKFKMLAKFAARINSAEATRYELVLRLMRPPARTDAAVKFNGSLG